MIIYPSRKILFREDFQVYDDYRLNDHVGEVFGNAVQSVNSLVIADARMPRPMVVCDKGASSIRARGAGGPSRASCWRYPSSRPASQAPPASPGCGRRVPPSG